MGAPDKTERKTVTRVKEYENGRLMTDTTTTVVQVEQPKPDAPTPPGFYL